MSDYKRHKADLSVNRANYAGFVSLEQVEQESDPIKSVRKRSRSVGGADGLHYEYYSSETKCEDIAAGDLLILQDDEIVPADCLVIKCFSGECEC